jgi:hypothetical protein
VYRLIGNLDAEDLSTLKEWEAEEVLRSEDSANPAQLSSTMLPSRFINLYRRLTEGLVAEIL